MADDLNPDLTDTTTEAPSGGAPDAQSDPFESGADSFDRAYVERLRSESANYRTRAKEYETYAKAFEPYTEQDRTVWNEAMRLVAEDPRQGGEYLRQVAEALLAEQQQEQPAPPADPGAEDRPLTMAEYRAMREAERAEAAKEADVARIESEAKGLGYDVSSHKYTTLLTVASRLPSGSIQEAHQMLEAERQAEIAAYLAAKAAEADGPQPPAGSGMAPSGEVQIRTFDDAKRALMARLSATQQQ